MKQERIFYGDDANQFFEMWYPISTVAGCAIFVHGGFWREKYDLSHANPFCAALAAKGVITANLEYRRVGQPGGGWPGTFDDVIAGVNAASEHLGDTPVVVGHSAGGHLALRLASESVPVKAVVALAPVADLRFAYELNLSNGAVVEFLGGTPDAIPDRYDEACASTHTSSTHRQVVHGVGDEDVPIDIARAYVWTRQNDLDPPRLLEIQDTGHMDMIDPKSLAGLIVIDMMSRLAEE
jgi:dipeptidyl aminopeptidase/acylaminoacyl peptidase